MKHYLLTAVLILFALPALATFTDLNHADYWGKTGIKKLTTAIDANFAQIEAGTWTIDAGPTATIEGIEDGNAAVVLDADEGDDNADTWTIRSTAADNDLDILNHTTIVATIDSAGLVFTLVGFDGIGAIDLDYGSADITDHTFVSDGGTVIIDGGITMADGTTIASGGTLDAVGAVDMDYGSADVTDHTFTTDGTGDAEIVLPDGSISSTEITTALADQIAYITVVGADIGAAGTGTITIQLKDAAGNDLAARALVRTWIGTADDFGPDALTDYSVTTGTSKEEVTDNAEYLAITDATGLIVMAVDNGGAGTVYAWAEVGGRIVASGAVELTAP